MMNNIVIGQYIPGSSFLYKMDPRSKILALILLMVTTFVLTDIIQILVLLSVLLVILKLGGIPIGRIVKGLRPIIVLLFFTFTFQVLFIKTGRIILDETLHYSFYTILLAVGVVLFWMITKRFIKFKISYFLMMIVGILSIFMYYPIGDPFAQGQLVIYTGGLQGAFFIMVRLIIIVTLSTILTLTTKPTDLTLGLEQLLKPLSIIKVSAEEIALIISIALRYIPTLLDEANKIMLAQASRGVDFKEGKLKDKVVQIISLLVPMFIISFKRSDELANAMEARNFVPGNRRTRLHILTWQTIDTITIIITAITIPVAILLRVMLG
ncbi:MAG: energy-coupling factor transporter transmembrane protein EcfT [Candidatus Izimaplasma sp.]|nr:energy-coupling factor transporter transmembrane protein EcfT [Candidatus Izimaplasma bacterium]